MGTGSKAFVMAMFMALVAIGGSQGQARGVPAEAAQMGQQTQ